MKALLVYRKKDNVFKHINRILENSGIIHKAVQRRRAGRHHVSGNDLVITLGGDGTFLRAAHLVRDELMLGVNPDPGKNEAFFARATKEDFEKKLDRIINRRYKVLKLLRLESRINGKRLPILALNEVFAGSILPWHTSMYKIKIENKEEYQKSSGVLIGTPAGSTAWIKSAGGARLPLMSRKFQYAARDPYFGRLLKPRMIKGVLGPDKEVAIKSDINRGLVIIDSVGHDYRFNVGDRIVVRPSKQFLNLVSF